MSDPVKELASLQAEVENLNRNLSLFTAQVNRSTEMATRLEERVVTLFSSVKETREDVAAIRNRVENGKHFLSRLDEQDFRQREMRDRCALLHTELEQRLKALEDHVTASKTERRVLVAISAALATLLGWLLSWFRP